jgi:hypothetical protein
MLTANILKTLENVVNCETGTGIEVVLIEFSIDQ